MVSWFGGHPSNVLLTRHQIKQIGGNAVKNRRDTGISMELQHLLYLASEYHYDRKIKMFSIACLRRVSGAYNGEVMTYLDLAEQVFDLETRSIRELREAAQEPEIAIYKAPFQLARHNAYASVIGVLEGIMLDTGMECHGCVDLFYEIIRTGNPKQVSLEVISLAQSVYDTGAGANELADVLQDEYQAKHLREVKKHPKGCWVLDLLLRKRK